MLAFTMQFSKHERTPTHNHHQHPDHPAEPGDKTRYGGRTGPHARTPPTNQADEARSGLKTPNTRPEGLAPVSSGPNSVPGPPDSSRDGFPEPARRAVLTSVTNQRNRIASAPPMSKPTRETFARGMSHGPRVPGRTRTHAASDAP
jgi:hypothetical protein